MFKENFFQKLQNIVKTESDSEPEVKRRNMKDTFVDADDPELAAAEILFKNSSRTNSVDGNTDAVRTRPGKTNLSVFHHVNLCFQRVLL